MRHGPIEIKTPPEKIMLSPDATPRTAETPGISFSSGAMEKKHAVRDAGWETQPPLDSSYLSLGLCCGIDDRSCCQGTMIIALFFLPRALTS